MIRQFAAEYAHKIQTAENQNAITQTEPDGPLDLTLSRSTQCAQGDWRAHIDVDAFFLYSLNSTSLHLYVPFILNVRLRTCDEVKFQDFFFEQCLLFSHACTCLNNDVLLSQQMAFSTSQRKTPRL